MTNQALIIRKATQNDVAILSEISIQAFRETYAEQNTPENLEKYIGEHFNIDQLFKELDNTQTQFYLLFIENKPIAYVKLGTGNDRPELQNQKCIEIERLYVLQAFHGYKIGSFLMDKCIELAREQGFDTIWLGVWMQNHKAIKAYQSWGFEIFGTQIFQFGDDPQDDYLMKKSLV